jgi:hypothetical protein
VREKKAGTWGPWGEGAYAAPLDALAYNGMQVNGSAEISQEKGTTPTVAGAGSAFVYVCDGWQINKNGAMVLQASTQALGYYPGLTNVLLFTVSTAASSLGASDYAVFTQQIEGYRISRLGWGTANAQPLTIGFWTTHHRTGTYTGTVTNNARSYAFTYTQNAADTPEYKIATIPGDTSGTWATGNAAGIQVNFAAACGTTFAAPSAGGWLGANYVAGPGQINGVAATSDVFRIGGIGVLPGTQAPTAAQSPLVMRPFDQELVTCKRYWQMATNVLVNTISTAPYSIVFPVEMRAMPVVTGGGAGFTASNLSRAAVTIYQTTQGYQNIIFDARL